MLEKLFWFGLGYLTARYLILKSGQEAYVQKEKNVIGKASLLKDDFIDKQSQFVEEYEEY